MGKRSIFGFVLFLTVLILTLGSPLAANDVKSPKADLLRNRSSASENADTALYKEIQAYGEKSKIDPVDAKVDRVWKAIPGYNGRMVDIEKSYKNMVQEGKFDENKIFYKEIQPKIHLEDLEPEPVYRGNPEKPMVALLINVAWGNEYIPTMLEVLEKHKLTSTFFFDGSWVKNNPELAKSIKNAGHEIGNHAYSHPDLSGYSTAQTTEELEKTNDVIQETLGVKPKWFAPPSGSFNANTVQVARQLGMQTILWTVDTVDWRKPETWEMVNRVVGKVENGSMILMHPTQPTAEGLDKIITDVKAKGYELGTVSKLMSEERIN
ncbi:MAG: polysaccharide deacetylase family protein [Clostridiales bacterium]|nr:polysaccharide deacetylase family protein [Clostridiales bacterium]